MSSFEGKVVLITGASRGIGYAIANAFQAQGALLSLSAKNRLDKLEEFNSAFCMRVDLSKRSDMTAFIEGTVDKFGRIDVFVNNAAYFLQSKFENITEEEFDDIIALDLKAPFILLQKVFLQMKKQNSGKIINIVSGAGIMGSSRAAHYAACKAGLGSLTKSLAKAAAKYNINVNAIAPGFIETDMISSMLKASRQKIISLIPLSRIGQSRDVASAVLFLASESSGYITGQTICVDGGHCMI
ncbi:MAG: glucose 1-dehydrogenase [Candidatus Omnitrophota bacterium]|nr:MAG: glucose 1-dehydrogenase [Candidatus Omnitrophota bacterium]